MCDHSRNVKLINSNKSFIFCTYYFRRNIMTDKPNTDKPYDKNQPDKKQDHQPKQHNYDNGPNKNRQNQEKTPPTHTKE